MTKLDSSLASIFITCLEYFRTNAADRERLRQSDVYRKVQIALTSTLSAMATLHAVNYPGWEIDKDHSGYLIKLDPPMLFRVPYHVLPTFPGRNELEALWLLSRAIRSGERSVIAISGSNVMRKIFEVVGDVDFCEYFPTDDAEGFEKIASNLDGTTHVACMKLAFSGKEWAFPWEDNKPNKDFFVNNIDSADKIRSTLKFDYIGNIDNLGVAEITNVVIAIDKKGQSAGLTNTFAAQEAPLVPIDWLPNQMNDPIEMGRYIDWLVLSIESLKNKGDMRKCLKRCASLSRVLFIASVTEEIVHLASTTPILLDHKINELEKLAAMLEVFSDPRSTRLKGQIKLQKDALLVALSARGGVPDEVTRRRFDSEANRIASQLISHVRPGDDPYSKKAA